MVEKSKMENYLSNLKDGDKVWIYGSGSSHSNIALMYSKQVVTRITKTQIQVSDKHGRVMKLRRVDGRQITSDAWHWSNIIHPDEIPYDKILEGKYRNAIRGFASSIKDNVSKIPTDKLEEVYNTLKIVNELIKD